MPGHTVKTGGAAPGNEDSDLDAFGEDENETGFLAKPAAHVAATDMWRVTSQQPWEFDGKACMLTCLESGDGEHLRFQVVRQDDENMTVICNRQQFQEVCDEQRHLSGFWQANAAIRKLLEEALAECPKRALPHAPAARRGSEDGDSLDSFGEDEAEPSSGSVARPNDRYTQEGYEWYVTSQEPWEFGGMTSTLTCLQSGDGEQLRFEALKAGGCTITVTCSRQQFQELCEEQAPGPGPTRVSAAIQQLFSEGLEEWPEHTPVRPHHVDGQKLKAMLRSWSRCTDDLVLRGDMKALLHELNPRLPDDMLERVLPNSTSEGYVSVEEFINSILVGPLA